MPFFRIHKVNMLVMSLEIRPLAALYLPPPLQKNVLHRVVFIGSPGRYAHAYGICTPFYCISLKRYIGGGGVTLPGVWFQGTLPSKKRINKIEFSLVLFLLKRFVVFALLWSRKIVLNYKVKVEKKFYLMKKIVFSFIH